MFEVREWTFFFYFTFQKDHTDQEPHMILETGGKAPFEQDTSDLQFYAFTQGSMKSYTNPLRNSTVTYIQRQKNNMKD